MCFMESVVRAEGYQLIKVNEAYGDLQQNYKDICDLDLLPSVTQFFWRATWLRGHTRHDVLLIWTTNLGEDSFAL